MKLLTDVDGDEVSLVNRAANRRKFLLLKGDRKMDTDLSEILEVPWEREGALLDEVRKDEAHDEEVDKCVIAAVRILKGLDGVLSPETVEKIGTALYPQLNPPLNTSGGVPAMGGLAGVSGSLEDDPPEGDAAGGMNPGSAAGSSLEGHASGQAKADPSDDDEDDADTGKKSWLKRRGKTRKEDVDPDELEKGDSVIDEERGTVETHAVPIQKEDGSWDFSGVSDEHRPFYTAMIQKQDETASELAKAKEQLAKADDTLLTRSMLEKAARYNHVAATDDLAPILKEAAQKMDSESFEKLEAVLAAAEERVTKGGLFQEMGLTGRGDAANKQDAESQIVAKANELVEKGTDLTFEAAYSKALADNPDLYSKWMSEHGMGV